MFGPLELLIILGIVLVIFGARRLPSLGRDLGSGMREFKNELVHPSDAEAKQEAAALDAPADRSPRGPAQT